MESISFTCPICYEEFNQTNHLPRISSVCGHTFCSECLTRILDQQQNAKCPFDQKQFAAKTLEMFPTNFIIFQVSDNNLDKEYCQNHKEEILFICFTDSCKICSYCVCNEHLSHNVEPIKRIKKEARNKKKQIEALMKKLDNLYDQILECLENVRKHLKGCLKGNKDPLPVENFELIVETNSFFEIEKERIKSIRKNNTGFGASLRQEIVELNNLFEKEDYFKDSDFFFKIRDQIEEKQCKINFIIEDIRSLDEWRQTPINFGDDVLSSRETWSEVSSSISTTLTKIIKHFSRDLVEPVENKSFIWNSELGLVSFNMKTAFSFKYCDAYLEISNERFVSQVIHIDLKKWKKIDEISLQLNTHLISEDEAEALVYICLRLKKVSSLKLKLNINQVSEGVCCILSTGLNSFSKIEIRIEGYKVTEENKGLLLLIRTMLSKMTNLKRLSLVMNKIIMNGQALIKIFENDSLARNLEEFSLFLTHSNASDNDVKQLLTQMPELRKFTLSLPGTSIEAILKQSVQKILQSMNLLQEFTCSLAFTKVPDEAICRVFPSFKDLKKFDLDLSFTRITDKGLISIAKALSNSYKTLETFSLCLRNTQVTDEGLCEILKRMPSIKRISLNVLNNNITDKSMEVLANLSLYNIERLETLNLCLNSTNVTDEGIKFVLESIINVRELSLDLRYTKISDISIKPFADKKLLTINYLKLLKIFTANTLISQDVRDNIRDFETRLLTMTI